MQALVIAQYAQPSLYDIASVNAKSCELLIKVYAASVNQIDVKLASGFPYKIVYDLAGMVVAVGTSKSNFKLGDEAYSRTMGKYRGSIAEYAISTESTTAKSLNRYIPLAAQTALQALQKGKKETEGLSGTGSFGVQLAKNMYGAGKIKELLGESAPDKIVDYTKEDIPKAIGKNNIDFMFNTVNSTVPSLPVMKKRGWTISNRVNYNYLSLKENTEDLEKLACWVDEGKIKSIIGMTVKLSDIEGVRKGCGIGKFIIEIN
ncbi:hypothetical protein F5884DRAFT_824838 [Xylogone sp. PMI_703]|nr:hypothetical protein F5884DRAFT_824838 [Xylogone sp. PMI_703]